MTADTGSMTPPPYRLAIVLEATTGGTRRHLFLLLSHIDLNAFQPTLFYSETRDAAFVHDLEAFRQRGIECVHIPMTRAISPWDDTKSFFRLLKALRRGRFDLLHAHSSKAGFLGRLAGRLAGVGAIIYSPHSFALQYKPSGFQGALYTWLERIAGLFQDHYLFVSEDERAVAERSRLAARRTMTLPILPNALCHRHWSQAADPEEQHRLRTRLGLSAEHRIIGMVAHFRPQKGHRHLLQAIPAVVKANPQARFLLIGGGPLLESARERIAALGVADRVVLTGPLEDLRSYYDIMNVFVLTSLWEGHPYALLEAFARGLPVVVTQAPGLKNLVEEEKTGLTVPIWDAAALASALLRVLQDEPLRESLSEGARRVFAQTPDLQDWVVRYETIYRDVFHRAQGKRSFKRNSNEG